MNLKSCPFCGSKHVFLEFVLDAYSGGKLEEVNTWLSARIWCDDCQASVDVPGYNSEAGNEFFISHDHNGERVSFDEKILDALKRDVIDKWNTRAAGV